jgi:HEAT repeat protein
MGRTLRHWIADLKDADADVRAQAAYTLARMGPNIRPAFPALKEAAKDDDPRVRQYAAEALGSTGPQALPVLLELLESEDTRFAAMRGLQRMEQDPLPELLQRLAKGEVRQRRAVAAALRFWWQRSGEFRPTVQRALNDPDGVVRIEAMEALRATGSDQPVPPDFVLAVLKDQNAEVRLRALTMVLANEMEPEPFLPTLEKLLHDPDKRVRVSAAGIVGRQDASRSMAMLAVARDGVKDTDEAVRERALSAIFQIVHPRDMQARTIQFRDDAVRAALPDLLAFLRHHQRQPKKLVQLILGNVLSLEPDAKEIVPVLFSLVRNADPQTSEQAALLLAVHFSNDPKVQSVLPEGIRKTPDRVRSDAMAALLLLKKRPDNLVHGLMDVLQDPSHSRLRFRAATILGELGAEANEALPALRRALEDKNPTVRQSALLAILRLEPDRVVEWIPRIVRTCPWQEGPPHELIRALEARAGEIVPVLVQGLKDGDPLYRLRAGFLLVELAPAVRSVIPDLQAALENKDPTVRILAALSLVRINARTEGIAPILRAGLTCNDYALREQVFQAIQQMGSAARECAPELIRVLKNKREGRLRSLALFALQNMDGATLEIGPAFMALVKDSDPQVRTDALHCLSRMRVKDKDLLITLLDVLHDDPNGPQQRQVVDAIRPFGPAASAELSKRLNDKDPLVRAAVLNLYVCLEGVNHDELYAALDRALQDDALNVRLTAANALLQRDRRSKEVPRPVMTVIKQCLESSDGSLRQQAINTLYQVAMRIGGREVPQEVTSLLLGQAKSKEARVRMPALAALLRMRQPPKEAEPLLLEALQDKDADVRRQALFHLRLPPTRMKEVVPVLVELLQSRDNSIMDQVIRDLAQAGREDKTAVAALIKHYQKLRPTSSIRINIVSALAHCGDNAKDAIPLCVKALKDDNDRLRQAAVQTLMRLDPANKVLVSALVDTYGQERRHDRGIPARPRLDNRTPRPLGAQAVKELCDILANDQDADRRAGAAIVLGTMVQDAKGATDALKNAMKDAHPRVRVQAADSYWRIANEARTPLPVLLAGLKDKDLWLRYCAAQVIGEMGKEDHTPRFDRLILQVAAKVERVRRRHVHDPADQLEIVRPWPDFRLLPVVIRFAVVLPALEAVAANHLAGRVAVPDVAGGVHVPGPCVVGVDEVHLAGEIALLVEGVQPVAAAVLADDIEQPPSLQVAHHHRAAVLEAVVTRVRERVQSHGPQFRLRPLLFGEVEVEPAGPAVDDGAVLVRVEAERVHEGGRKQLPTQLPSGRKGAEEEVARRPVAEAHGDVEIAGRVGPRPLEGKQLVGGDLAGGARGQAALRAEAVHQLRLAAHVEEKHLLAPAVLADDEPVVLVSEGDCARRVQVRQGRGRGLAFGRVPPHLPTGKDPKAAVGGQGGVAGVPDLEGSLDAQVLRVADLDLAPVNNDDAVPASCQADGFRLRIDFIDEAGRIEVARPPLEAQEFLAFVGDVQGVPGDRDGVVGRAPAPGGLLALAVALHEQDAVHLAVLVQPGAASGLIPLNAAEGRAVSGDTHAGRAVLHPVTGAVGSAVAAERVAHPAGAMDAGRGPVLSAAHGRARGQKECRAGGDAGWTMCHRIGLLDVSVEHYSPSKNCRP